jgi:hypothetical protein
MISTAIKGTDTASGIDLTQLSSAGKSGGASFQKIMSKSLSSNVNNKASQNMVQTKTASGMKSTSTQQNTKQVSAQDDTAASTAKKTSDNTRSTLSDNSDKLTDAGEKIKDFLKEKLGVTDEEFEKQLASIKAQGADRLIIDLRMNPGGLVDTVISIMNQILTKGRVLSYHTRNGDDRTFDITGIETPLPMVILIDRNSASASEILAGAVQDKKEGIIIGETSYGKGTVQSVIQNGNKSALKISIAEYRTAAGRIIDKTGITPDIAIKQTGHVFKQEDDNVLKKAIEVLSQ